MPLNGPGYPDSELLVDGRPLSTEARGSYLDVGVASPGPPPMGFKCEYRFE